MSRMGDWGRKQTGDFDSFLEGKNGSPGLRDRQGAGKEA